MHVIITTMNYYSCQQKVEVKTYLLGGADDDISQVSQIARLQYLSKIEYGTQKGKKQRNKLSFLPM